MSVHGLVGAPAARSVDTPITRSEVLERARIWADDPVPYSMYKNYQGYRTDCSGYVSMTWRLGRSATTGTFGPYTHSITKSQLKPGDVLDYNNTGPGVGHVVLFEKWANEKHSSYWAFEQTPGQTKHRIVPYPYFPGRGGPYKPLRYDKIVDDGALGNSHDINGDQLADVVARDAKGALYYYQGKGDGTFAARSRSYSSGWSGYDRLLVSDLSGDGRADIVARTSKGALYYYKGKGNGKFAARVKTANSGWNQYYRLLSADVNGDGRADLLARTSTGTLYYYRGKGNGTFAGRVRTYQSTWVQYDRWVAADVNADGQADVLARTSKGALYYYKGKGNGKFAARVKTASSGWSQYSWMLAADLSGDGKADLLARNAEGVLYYYKGKGNGKFATRVRSRSGDWTIYNTIP